MHRNVSSTVNYLQERIKARTERRKWPMGKQ